MHIDALTHKHHIRFEKLVKHPLQSWAWGDFKKKTGVSTKRFGVFEKKKLAQAYQLTIHTLPLLGWKVGYFPKGELPDERQLAALKQMAHDQNLIFIKMEPNAYQKVGESRPELKAAKKLLKTNGAVRGKHLFTPYSFVMDISPSEDELLAQCKSKTRYNIRLATKHGVEVAIDDSKETFEAYIDLWRETTSRQGFYSHDESYHRQMWQIMRQAGIAHLAKATYQGKIISVWVIFIYKGVLYYPYGASSREHRNVMANNLLAWEVIKYGKSKGCHTFDMWGSLGPDPDPNHSWYGFHKFKEGYGGDLMEFLGTYDLVVDPLKYQMFQRLDELRWFVLRLKARVFN